MRGHVRIRVLKGGDKMCHEIGCGCGQHGHHVGRGAVHHAGCCCAPAHHVRHFPTREEIVGQLEGYLESLRAQAKAIEERIAEFKKIE